MEFKQKQLENPIEYGNMFSCIRVKNFLFSENSQMIEVKKNNQKERGRRCLVQKIFK